MQIYHLTSAFALLAYFPVCHADLVNRTIDDHYGDPVTGFKPVFFPPGIWADQTCPAWNPQTSTGCTIQPDKSKAFDNTWTSTTYVPSYQNINIALNFTGTAIWVYFILANSNAEGDLYTNTNLNFTLDGLPAGSFSHAPDNSTYSLIYNATVFSQTDLTNSPHTLLISVNDYNSNTFVCFDWAMYTAESSGNNPTSNNNPTTTSNSDSTPSNSILSTGAIIGIAISTAIGVVTIIIVLLAFVIHPIKSKKMYNATFGHVFGSVTVGENNKSGGTNFNIN